MHRCRHGGGEREAALFLSHGRADEILPFVGCSQRIDRTLRDAGFVVRFEAFLGGHEVPPPIAQAAFRWLLGG